MKKISILFLFLLSIGLVSAASFVNLEPGGIIEGTYEFRVRAAFEDLRRCDIHLLSEELGKSVDLVIYAESTNTIYASGFFDTTALGDASDWIIYGQCTYTDGGDEPIEPLEHVTVDNTVPQLSVVEPFELDAEYWDFMCVAANTATVTIGGQDYAMNMHGALCRFRTDDAPEGDFDIVVRISDGKDVQTLTFKNVDKTQLRDPLLLQQFLEAQAQVELEEKFKETNGLHWPLVLAIGFIVIVIYVVSRKKE